MDDLVAIVAAELGPKPVDLLAQSMGGIIAIRLALRYPRKVRRIVLTATSGGVDTARDGMDWRPDYRRLFPTAASWITYDEFDHTPELKKIKHPTLLLWGDSDPISPVSVGQRLAALMPNAKLSIVPGGDHGFVQDRPASVAGLITKHLA